MGLFNFVKEAGEKLWDTVTGNATAEDQSAKLKDHLNKTGLPGIDKVDVQVVDGKAVVTGDAVSQETEREDPGGRRECRRHQRCGRQGDG